MKILLNVLFFLLSTTILLAQSFIIEPIPLKEKLKKAQEINNPLIAYKKGVKIKQLDSLITLYNGADTTLLGYAKKDIYFYDSLSNSTVQDIYYKYGTGMPWEYEGREENHYDSNDNLIELGLYSDWNATNNSFESRSRYQLTYASNQLDEIISSYWDDASQSWILFEKETTSYNASGYRTEIISQDYTNGQWEDKHRWTYTYNTSNLVSLEELYNTPNGSWYNYRKKEYTYNGSNELTQELESDIYSTGWEPKYRMDISYFSWGKITENSEWDFSNWITYNRLEQSFDALNNLTSETFYRKDQATQILKPEYSHDFTYDDDFAYAVLQTTLNEEECRHQLLSYSQKRSINGGPLEQYLIGDYYWTNLATSISEPLFTNSDSHTVFPNPANDYLMIKLENAIDPISVELFNASGQRVISQQVNGNALSLKDLPTGFYSYMIRQDGKAYSGKVIVE